MNVQNEKKRNTGIRIDEQTHRMLRAIAGLKCEPLTQTVRRLAEVEYNKLLEKLKTK